MRRFATDSLVTRSSSQMQPSGRRRPEELRQGRLRSMKHGQPHGLSRTYWRSLPRSNPDWRHDCSAAVGSLRKRSVCATKSTANSSPASLASSAAGRRANRITFASPSLVPSAGKSATNTPSLSVACITANCTAMATRPLGGRQSTSTRCRSRSAFGDGPILARPVDTGEWPGAIRKSIAARLSKACPPCATLGPSSPGVDNLMRDSDRLPEGAREV